jgi:hypothetical protein
VVLAKVHFPGSVIVGWAAEEGEILKRTAVLATDERETGSPAERWG